MNNINILEEEYNEYVRLSNEKNSLESSLQGLSGHNDEDSVQRADEISKRLEEINKELSLYNQVVLSNMQNYLNLGKGFDEISKDIKAIEDLSNKEKKSNKNAEFVTLSSAEGRDKQIVNELSADYIKLTEEKRKIKNERNKILSSLNRYHSLKKNNPTIGEEEVIDQRDIIITEEKSEKEKIRDAISNIESNNSLSLKEKRNLIEEQLNRIFELSNLPNQGKKNLITYAGKKYSIPEDLMRIYRFTYMRLRNIDKKIEGMNNVGGRITSEETIPVDSTDKDLLEERLQDYGIDYDKIRTASDMKKKKAEPIEPSIVAPTVSSAQPYFKPADPKVFDTSIERDKEMHEKFGIPFDPEKQRRMNELAAKIFNSRNEELEEVRFREGVKQKINTARGYVTTTTKRVVSSLKKNTKNVIISIKNTVKEKKDEISYQIVNRTVKFKDNTCQKVKEYKSKFASIRKSTLEGIRKPFDSLREKREGFVTKKDLREMVVLLKEQNQLLLEQNKALTRKLVNNSGFISTAAFIITTSVLITIVIFLVVGFIVFR